LPLDSSKSHPLVTNSCRVNNPLPFPCSENHLVNTSPLTSEIPSLYFGVFCFRPEKTLFAFKPTQFLPALLADVKTEERTSYSPGQWVCKSPWRLERLWSFLGRIFLLFSFPHSKPCNWCL